MTDGLHTYKPLPLVRHRWMDSAACASVGYDLFYPEGNGTHIAAEEARAVKVCQGCPVQTDCLAYALENDERYGVWGGMTPTELAKLHGRKKRA